jgi:hypothetical protein
MPSKDLEKLLALKDAPSLEEPMQETITERDEKAAEYLKRDLDLAFLLYRLCERIIDIYGTVFTPADLVFDEHKIPNFGELHGLLVKKDKEGKLFGFAPLIPELGVFRIAQASIELSQTLQVNIIYLCMLLKKGNYK